MMVLLREIRDNQKEDRARLVGIEGEIRSLKTEIMADRGRFRVGDELGHLTKVVDGMQQTLSAHEVGLKSTEKALLRFASDFNGAKELAQTFSKEFKNVRQIHLAGIQFMERNLRLQEEGLSGIRRGPSDEDRELFGLLGLDFAPTTDEFSSTAAVGGTDIDMQDASGDVPLHTAAATSTKPNMKVTPPTPEKAAPEGPPVKEFKGKAKATNGALSVTTADNKAIIKAAVAHANTADEESDLTDLETEQSKPAAPPATKGSVKRKAPAATSEKAAKRSKSISPAGAAAGATKAAADKAAVEQLEADKKAGYRRSGRGKGQAS